MESAGINTESDPAAAGAAGQTLGPAAARAGRSLEPRSVVGPTVISALVACAFLFIPSIFSLYYVDAWTQVAIYSIVALGLGVLVGRVGMVSLGQVAVLAMGAWVSARLLFATGLPFPLVLLAGGLITMVLGTLVGLPALRMSGLYLALITLMLAGAITLVYVTEISPSWNVLLSVGTVRAREAPPLEGHSRSITPSRISNSPSVAVALTNVSRAASAGPKIMP